MMNVVILMRFRSFESGKWDEAERETVGVTLLNLFWSVFHQYHTALDTFFNVSLLSLLTLDGCLDDRALSPEFTVSFPFVVN